MFEGIRITLYLIYFFLGVVVLGVATVIILMYDRNIRPVSGRHALLGQIGRAKQDIPAGKLGKIYIFGEYWGAICDDDLKDEEAVKVIEVHDKFVKVVKSDSLPEAV